MLFMSKLTWLKLLLGLGLVDQKHSLYWVSKFRMVRSEGWGRVDE